MEVVIPPRDHRPTTYRYTWDENGEVERMERVSESVDLSSHRNTLRFPFQNNNSTSSPSSSPDKRFSTAHHPHHTPTTWQHASRAEHTGYQYYPSVSSPSTVDNDLIPDYVVNYLRGETPETVALRASMRPRGGGGARGVNLEGTDGAHRSRVADFYFDATGTNSVASDDERRNLSGEKGGSGNGNNKRRTRFAGWRFGVAVNALVSFFILIVAVICLSVAAAKFGMFGTESAIYTGACDAARRTDLGLRIVINLFVVALLGMANYAVQVLASPTREEVDAAHGRHRWLDIGIPSLRNLGHISVARVFIVAFVALSALSIQFLYNGVIFVSRTTTAPTLVFATEPFLSGARFSNASETNTARLSRIDLLSLQDGANRGRLANLSTAECLTYFSGAVDADFSTVVVIVSDVNSRGNSLIQTYPPGPHLADLLNDQIREDIILERDSISFCLAQRTGRSPSCQVKLSSPLLAAVALLNLILVISYASSAALLKTFHPLATLGDALSSFIQVPDPATRSACLLTKADVRAGRWPLQEAQYWAPRRHFWLQTPSPARWAVFLAAWVVPAVLAGVALGMGIRAHPEGRLGPFGEPSAYQVLPFATGASRVGVGVLAGLPHLLLAVLYLCLNALLSTYFLGHEMSQFALPDVYTPLRVSGRARGVQQSSLYITLPRPWSWLLLALFFVANFFAGNAVAVVAVDLVPPPSTAFPVSTRRTALATSPTALLALAALLLVLLIIPLALGLRRADDRASYVSGRPAGNPLAMRGGSCSAVVSARCHGLDPGEVVMSSGTRDPGRRRRRRPDVAKEGIAWGVLREGVGMEVGRTGFGGDKGGELGMIAVGRAYA